MISDKERREVAERLRMCARDVNGTRDFSMYLAYWVGVAEDEIADGGNPFTVAADRRCAEMTLEKLADLIDPTCHMEPEGEGFRCSTCGTYHDMSGFEEFPWPRCPECGSRVKGSNSMPLGGEGR